MEWVLITGASRGIGSGIARKLARKGFGLILWSRTESDLNELADDYRSLGAQIRVATVDVSNSNSVTTAGTATLDGIESLRGCILNAGAATFGNILNFSDDDWRTTIATNLDGAFFTLKVALPLLEKCPFSQIIGMGSQSAIFAFENQSGYCASKWGLSGLIETVRREKRANGIRITNLVMGGVDTFFRGKKPGDRPGSLTIDEVSSVVETLFAMPLNVEVREIHLSSMLNTFGPFPEFYKGK
ncbi:MAG: SDR family oxidoreductase [Alphaproteobacteria bacterium]|nr:SDR family oxidoreductase [Alphaproteobacteria bacterium]